MSKTSKAHGKGSLALAAPLVHIPGRLVEVPQHGHQPVAVPIGAADVGPTGADMGDGHTNATSLG